MNLPPKVSENYKDREHLKTVDFEKTCEGVSNKMAADCKSKSESGNIKRITMSTKTFVKG